MKTGDFALNNGVLVKMGSGGTLLSNFVVIVEVPFLSTPSLDWMNASQLIDELLLRDFVVYCENGIFY